MIKLQAAMGLGLLLGFLFLVLVFIALPVYIIINSFLEIKRQKTFLGGLTAKQKFEIILKESAYAFAFILIIILLVFLYLYFFVDLTLS